MVHHFHGPDVQYTSHITVEGNPTFLVSTIATVLFHHFSTDDGGIFSGTLINGCLRIARVAKLVSYQRKERYFLCLKAQESYMDCSLCTLPSRISTTGTTSSLCLRTQLYFTDNFNIRSSRTSEHNISGQLDSPFHPHRNVIYTVTLQLNFSLHAHYPPFLQILYRHLVAHYSCKVHMTQHRLYRHS